MKGSKAAFLLYGTAGGNGPLSYIFMHVTGRRCTKVLSLRSAKNDQTFTEDDQPYKETSQKRYR